MDGVRLQASSKSSIDWGLRENYSFGWVYGRRGLRVVEGISDKGKPQHYMEIKIPKIATDPKSTQSNNNIEMKCKVAIIQDQFLGNQFCICQG